MATRAPAFSALDPLRLEVPTFKRAVYDTPREMILSFELPPGHRLVESDIAARMGVSKTPVREALALLDSDGLLERAPYRGAAVRWLAVSEMREQRYLVDALEIPSLPLVVERITSARLSEIRGLVDQLKRGRRDAEQHRFGELSVRIHALLLSSTGFPRVHDLVSIVLGPIGLRYDRVLVYPFDDAWDVLTALTTLCVEAVRRRDARRAVGVVHDHRDELQRMALERIRRPEIARFFQTVS